eukprot:1160325-Pelagomonas_calceolata.AAC.5
MHNKGAASRNLTKPFLAKPRKEIWNTEAQMEETFQRLLLVYTGRGHNNVLRAQAKNGGRKGQSKC